jgi:hypothetical protein
MLDCFWQKGLFTILAIHFNQPMLEIDMRDPAISAATRLTQLSTTRSTHCGGIRMVVGDRETSSNEVYIFCYIIV